MVFALLCMLDLLSTVYVIESGYAIEGNPLLAPVVAQGWLAFAVVKALTFLIPIAIIEIIRPLRPNFIRWSMRFASVGYVAVYGLGSLQLNGITLG